MGSEMTWAYSLVAFCLGASAFGGLAWLRPSLRRLQILTAILGWACLVVAFATWVMRFRQAGHLPLFGTYESSLSLVLACLLAGPLWVLSGGRGWSTAGLWPGLCAISAALLLHGFRFDPTIYALTISERSLAVDVHAFIAWFAFASLGSNAAVGLWLLISPERSVAEKRPDSLSDEGQGHTRSRALAWTLSLGFVLHTAMLASGSFYKFLLFGTAWSFDPIETLGFVAWVAYGTLLHMHLFARWGGSRLAKWCLGLFVILVISYRGIVYFPAWSTYHIFDMDLRIHVTGVETQEPNP